MKQLKNDLQKEIKEFGGNRLEAKYHQIFLNSIQRNIFRIITERIYLGQIGDIETMEESFTFSLNEILKTIQTSIDEAKEFVEKECSFKSKDSQHLQNYQVFLKTTKRKRKKNSLNLSHKETNAID